MHAVPIPSIESGTGRLNIANGAAVLHGFALDDASALLEAVEAVRVAAPFRHLVTPGGHTMSVAMTNCGSLGWVSDRKGYRYAPLDPESGKPWPALPRIFETLAERAAAELGFSGYRPECCLINHYLPGTRLSLHQDRDEKDGVAPIVSVSLGLPATFLWGGFERSDKTTRIPLSHGDVVVWGGPSRMRFHGVAPVRDGEHPATGRCRINLTFRKVM
ncbi:MAG: DNA oxidative demethylase AlkB [Betaproteobacteria bacterium]|nr:DNA oxidative demethylase AlkB [Betaproteobacteria bacterium]